MCQRILERVCKGTAKTAEEVGMAFLLREGEGICGFLKVKCAVGFSRQEMGESGLPLPLSA